MSLVAIVFVLLKLKENKHRSGKIGKNIVFGVMVHLVLPVTHATNKQTNNNSCKEKSCSSIVKENKHKE